MEFEQILGLIDHVSAAGLSSFVYETEGVKLSMKGGQPVCASDARNIAETACAGTQTVESGTQKQLEGKIVTSPLVGTFYAAPSEDAEPFVRVGDSVKKGQVLAIVEAMKLMNEIESEYDGVIVRILVENGEPVEYGQPLFCLE